VGVTTARRAVSGLAFALAGFLFAASAVPADAARRKTRFDGIRDCERVGNIQLRRNNPAFRHFMIDRSNVTIDRYSERVGPLFVATVYHGRANYESVTGLRPIRFICLHGGMYRRALFVYALPD